MDGPESAKAKTSGMPAIEIPATDSQLLHRLIYHSNDEIYILDPKDGKFSYVNERAVRDLGYSRDELLKMGVQDIDINFPNLQAWQELSRKIQESDAMLVRSRLLRKDGTTYPVEVSVRNAPGRSRDYFIAVVRDTTERVEQEQALERARGELEGKAVQLEAVTASLSRYLETGDLKQAYQMILRSALDQTRSEYGFVGVVVGEDLRVLAHEGIVWDRQDDPFFQEALQSYSRQGFLTFSKTDSLYGAVLRSREPVISDHPEQDPRASGLPRHHPPLKKFLGVPVIWMGEVVGVVGLANASEGYRDGDLERIQILAQSTGVLCDTYRRMENEKTLEKIVHNISEGTAAVVGKAFFDPLVRSLAQALGVKWAFVSRILDPAGEKVRLLSIWNGTDHIPPFEYATEGTPCEACLKGKLTAVAFNVQEEYPEDEFLVREGIQSYLAIPLFDSNGRLLGHLGVLDTQPLSQEERNKAILKIFGSRAAAELERLQAEKLLLETEKAAAGGRLAARVAHEINNPLAGIKNAFLLIEEAVPPDHARHHYLGKVQKEIDRMAGIVRQLFDQFRPGKESVREFRVAQILQDVASLLEKNCLDQGAVLKIHEPDHDLKIRTPEGPFRQALYNLLLNAIEASPSGGIISVGLEEVEHSLRLRITNQGQGIPEKYHDQIFQPFFSTKGGGSTTGGLGLGLSVTKDIVEALGGRIDFESREDQGTTFEITLPLRMGGGEEL